MYELIWIDDDDEDKVKQTERPFFYVFCCLFVDDRLLSQPTNDNDVSHSWQVWKIKQHTIYTKEKERKTRDNNRNLSENERYVFVYNI